MSPETKRGIKKLALLKNINLYKLVIFLWQYVLCNDYFFESFNFRSNESILGIIISLNGSVSIPCAPPLYVQKQLCDFHQVYNYLGSHAQ